MDNILKYSELAAALDMATASISMAIKNRQLFAEEGKKLINVNKAENQLWIERQVSKGKVFDISKAYAKRNNKISRVPVKKKPVKPKQERKKEPTVKSKPKKLKKEPEEESENDTYFRKKRQLELKKSRLDVEKLELQNKKLKGELIPYDAVKTVFLYAVETLRNTYQQEVDALANVFIRRLKGNHDQFVELQKELTEKINEIQKQAKEDLLQGLKGVQAEYREVRSRGEKK